nr:MULTISPECIES: winged helix-turn-helix domain-containing protein [unclassified Streptomyces]
MPQGVRKLLVRNGWSCQVPARRAMERDDDEAAGLREFAETRDWLTIHYLPPCAPATLESQPRRRRDQMPSTGLRCGR